MAKNIVLLSDGTGNSAAKLFKTNVWRLYMALDRTEPPQPAPKEPDTRLRNARIAPPAPPPPLPAQIAFYDDGVGTSGFRPLALLGGAFGIGLARNVRDLYGFLCRNFEPGDSVYAFGFSRGAFTIRVLVGMIASQGVIPGRTLDPAELDRRIRDAYRRDRRDYETNWTRLWRGEMWSTPTKTAVDPVIPEGNIAARVRFVGLWDTVDAYGLPIDELKRGLDRWVFGLSFPDQDLSPIVDCACHAISLDDERRTFHPVLWNEAFEERLVAAGTAQPGRLKQVWFAGMHSNVGGGYAKDGMAYVALAWMIGEAEKAGLRFHDDAKREIARLAELHDEMGDSRAGLAAYYRYDPRRIQSLCDDDYNGVHIARPKIHHSVLDRVRDQQSVYVPHTVPGDYDVIGPGGSVVASAYETPDQARARERLLEKAWDLVWWRRLVYFLTLGFTAWLILLPWLCSTETAKLQDQHLSIFSTYLIAVSQVLPGWADIWIGAFRKNIDQFVMAATGVVASLAFGMWLEARVRRRAVQAWGHLTLVEPDKNDGFKPLSAVARVLRTSKPLVAAYRWVARSLLPFLFFLATLGIVVLLANRALFDMGEAMGWTCSGSDATRAVAAADTPAATRFQTDAPCFATGLTLEGGQTYQIRFSVEQEWLDDTFATDPRGFTACTGGFVFTCAGPLRRYLSARWFEPIARVGRYGLDRHRLEPRCAEPSCGDRDFVSVPFTPRTSGELFLTVNDAVLGLPGAWKTFYANNHGDAAVKVVRLPPSAPR